MDTLDQVIKQFTKDYNDILEHIFKEKIQELTTWAYHNEPALFNIVCEVDSNNIDALKKELERFGYELEISLEKNPYSFEKTADSFKAIIEIDKMKVKVKKLIFEQ